MIVWNVFYVAKVYIFRNFIKHTIYGEKANNIKTFSVRQKNVTKNLVFFFHSQAPTHHSFTFNLRLLNWLKQKVHHFSESLSRIFDFWFCLVFTKIFTFVQQKLWIL